MEIMRCLVGIVGQVRPQIELSKHYGKADNILFIVLVVLLRCTTDNGRAAS